jgi:hypothetical protein
MIGGDDLDLKAGMLLHEIFGRHFGSRNRAFTGIIRIGAGGVIEDSDLHCARRVRKRDRTGRQNKKRYSKDML